MRVSAGHAEDHLRSHIETRLRGRSYRCQQQDQKDVPADTVVFVNCLCVIHTAVKARGIELCETDNGLKDDEDVGYEAESAVYGRKVC